MRYFHNYQRSLIGVEMRTLHTDHGFIRMVTPIRISILVVVPRRLFHEIAFERHPFDC